MFFFVLIINRCRMYVQKYDGVKLFQRTKCVTWQVLTTHHSASISQRMGTPFYS